MVVNMTGKAMTVRGEVDPDRLGVTLMHEHLYIDLRRNHLPPQQSTATVLHPFEAKVSLSNLHLAREAYPILDNYLLTDEQAAIEEVSEYRKHGGHTIVDVTSFGLKRDPLGLKRASEATGLNIVMGTGWYQKAFHPQNMDECTVEGLADDIVRDITVGADVTGVRSGIIGEIGINGRPIIENETKSILAAAQASRTTGAAISFHSPPLYDEKHKMLDIAAEGGADLTRVVLGHSDHMAQDVTFMLELLERGVYIEFDVLGRVVTSLSPGYDAIVSSAIPRLIEAGYGNRILLSQDVCWKVHLKRYGGTGYSFVLEKFLPHLLDNSVTEARINEIMVENPKRVLTFGEPK